MSRLGTRHKAIACAAANRNEGVSPSCSEAILASTTIKPREVEDYSAVIAMPDAPADQRAKALLGRGMAKWKQGDMAGAAADLIAVIAMPNAPEKIKELAKRFLANINKNDGDGPAAPAGPEDGGSAQKPAR